MRVYLHFERLDPLRVECTSSQTEVCQFDVTRAIQKEVLTTQRDFCER